MKTVYVTGNSHKARLFNKMVGIDLVHQKVDIDELQSLDLKEIVRHKVIGAYEKIGKPVIVEDTRLTFNALGKLPGPLIKWFLDELGAEGICKLLNSYDDRSATAGAAIAYYDGDRLEIFETSLNGFISDEPRGTSGFGWNAVFIPVNSEKTLGEMDEEEFISYYKKIKPFNQTATFLKYLDKA